MQGIRGRPLQYTTVYRSCLYSRISFGIFISSAYLSKFVAKKVFKKYI